MTVSRHEILIQNGYEVFTGYCFKTPPCEDENALTFVEQDEAEKVFKEGAKTYYLRPNDERIYLLEDAWEMFYEDYSIEKEWDIDMKEFDQRMLK